MNDLEFPIPVMGERNDLEDRDIPVDALRICENVMRSERGNLTIRPGYKQYGEDQPGTRIMGISSLRTAAGADKQVAATQTGIWAFDGTDWQDITLGGSELTGSTTNHVRFSVMSVSGTYKIIATNAKDTPKIWNGAAATYSNLGGTPGVSITSAVVANRLLLLQAPDLVVVSEFNDPETYPAGYGFNSRLIDGGDLMVGMVPITRTAAAIIGEESQWVARAQTGSVPFRFERIDKKPGPLSSAACVSLGIRMYYLATDYNVYSFDGVECTPVGWAMKPWVASNIDFTNKSMCHGAYHDKIGKIFWHFPAPGVSGPNLGIFLDPRTGEMGRLSYGRYITASGRIYGSITIAWDDLTGTWDTLELTYPTWESFGDTASLRRTAFGDSTGTIFASNAGNGSDNGLPVAVRWEVPLKPYAGWPNNIVPSTFETFFKKTAISTSVRLSLGATNTLMVDPTYTDMGTFDISTDQRNDIDLASFGEARFVTVRHDGSIPYGQMEWLGGLLQYGDAEPEKGPTG